MTTASMVNEEAFRLEPQDPPHASIVRSAAWYQATTLAERLALRLAHPIRSQSAARDYDLAGRRMQRWRSQAPFTDDALFAQRLDADGMTEHEFLDLLGESAEAVRDRFSTPPRWLVQLAQAFSQPDSASTISMQDYLPDEKMAGFLDVIQPLIAGGWRRVQAGAHALAQQYLDPPFDPHTVVDVLFAPMPQRLMMILNRTLVLELNVARLQGLLDGETPDERFQSFVQHLSQRPAALALLQEYPVLARQLVTTIDQWVQCSLEFLEHLCQDWSAIRTTFSPDADPGLLSALQGDAGDQHRGGRSVLIPQFNGGVRLVYKPKSLAVDVHFQELLTWLNQRGDHPPFRILSVLDRGDHGWVEFAHAAACESEAQLSRFYERQGAYIALLYALEATDFHYENLIAAGEHPVLVDLEALFTPLIEKPIVKEAGQLASSIISYSVMNIGLLPLRLWSTDEADGIDLSGLGAIPGQITPYGVPMWEAAGTDEMRLVRKRVEMPGGQNRPALNGAYVDVQDYAGAIAAGFDNMYRLILQHRSALLASDGPLARFAGDEVRFILRPTKMYGALRHESLHPDMLRDGLARERLLDQLWVGAEQVPALARVIPAERDDLHEGDIPLFTTRPNSHDLWTSTNKQIPGFFAESGLDRVNHRLRQLGEDDLTQQLWFIRASLATLSATVDHAERPAYRLTQPRSHADHKRLLAAAQAVGDRLDQLALRGEDGVTWIGLAFSETGQNAIAPLGTHLYDGVAGVVYFLAYLGAVTGEQRYTTLAQAALVPALQQIELTAPSITSIGGYLGWGGIIYALTHLGVLWKQPALFAEAEAMLEYLPPLIERDQLYGIVDGAAGCIGSLLALHHATSSARALALAVQCGDHLIAHAQPMARGIGWSQPDEQTKGLAGFSHGAAGIALALIQLFSATREERFRAAALAALDYERSLFSPEAGNWPDLRRVAALARAAQGNQTPFMVAWCHGAPGIGMARLRMLAHHSDEEIEREINAAVHTTLQKGFGANHSLCHGDLGNLELLLQANQTLENPQWQAEMSRLAATILEDIEQHGWRCGVPSEVETSGLMVGLAGIGYELLRLAEPARVPSVLTLEPPLVGLE